MIRFNFKKKLKKQIVFFYEDIIEKQLLEIVSKKFKKNNYSVQFSKNFSKETDIGFFASPSSSIKKHSSKLSIISLGGMDQGKLFWPNIWLKEPWNKFDIGLLPGKHWSNMWQKCSWFNSSRPKYLVAEVGWPKTQKFISKMKLNNKLNKKFTILYAPCFESDLKGHNVVDAIKNTNIKLMVKHHAWKEPLEIKKFSDIKKNIKKISIYAKKNLGDRVKVIKPTEDIFNYFSSADLLITDESSVIYESLLFNIPALSCKDWPMRSNNTNKPRKIKMDKDVCIYINKNNLHKTIKMIKSNYKKYQKHIHKKKEKYFSNLTKCNDIIYKLVDDIVIKKQSSNYLKPRYKVKNLKSFFFKSLNN